MLPAPSSWPGKLSSHCTSSRPQGYPQYDVPYPNAWTRLPMNSHLAVLLALFEVSRTANAMCVAGIILIAIGALAAKNDLAQARGLDKVVALGYLCFAAPLAVFGAEHFSAAQGISQGVPKFMPWPLFWAYFVGFALVAASLSIATKIQVRWSGLLFGCMMFLFVAMMDLPGTLADTHNRISWVLLFRELSFGSGGWILAGVAWSKKEQACKLIMIGRIIVGVTAILYGVQHFFHPLNVPGVPLEKFMPTWIPLRPLISYVTGLILLIAGAGILLARKTRMAATYLGSWILLLVVVIYGPILITSLLDPSTDVKVEGLNYFFDTLLFAGTILALASAAPQSE
jgi:uncharacterized membrane protein